MPDKLIVVWLFNGIDGNSKDLMIASNAAKVD